MASQRPTYSREQLEQYFTHIKLPRDQWNFDASNLSPKDTLTFLALLQKYTLVTVPFENFSIHYSMHHTVIIDPTFVFNKIVAAGHNRGGYCMENNTLFYTVLLSLGFDVYPAGARVSAGKGHGGYGHRVSLVTIDGQKYLADVGYGGAGAIRPIPLINSAEGGDSSASEVDHIKPSRSRLVYRNIEEFTKSDQKIWELQYQRSPGGDWMDCYAFTENEFLPSDYMVMNIYTSTCKLLFFTQKLVGVKFTLDENNEINGSIILNDNRLKREVHWEKAEEIDGFKDEMDRVNALKKYFNMTITAEEAQGIAGLTSAVAPSTVPEG